uniref:Transcription factor CP2-like n=1 Tax=Phallusia mammillata TaxID=59560 RepID=A0A6F9DUV9_9ASCI|nr:transcription factor CP2-like [Phallusia mammillata]
MDGMESDLVKDFDNNLSGLGLELGANAYNMSEVLNLPIFKQESILGGNQGLPPFQYMLCAPTSPATKVYEETLTYLNQGQSYEIKLKKLRDMPDMGALNLVKSQLRVVFHDRRLQYTEYAQFQSWRLNRPGDRLLNIDVPMSVGVIQPKENPDQVNLVEFVWDLDKEASVWVQVHCISTEFTARKHGGEKGVPFRIQIDTYTVDTNGEMGQHVHSASCQIKVFKPKGADRKQKTDKDKMERRSAQEKLKYQPSYDSTLLSECTPNYIQSEQIEEVKEILTSQPRNRIMDQANDMSGQRLDFSILQQNTNNLSYPDKRCRSIVTYNPSIESSIPPPPPCAPMNASTSSQQERPPSAPNLTQKQEVLVGFATVAQTQDWLQRNRFGSFIKTFNNYTGADLLTLSRDDITQICGHADGIRLYNALRAKNVQPRLTLYLTPATIGGDNELCIYKAYYLERATVAELAKATSDCIFDTGEGSRPNISRILYQPPRSSIHVLVTDEVVSLMKDESSFTVSLVKNEVSSGFQIILKP